MGLSPPRMKLATSVEKRRQVPLSRLFALPCLRIPLQACYPVTGRVEPTLCPYSSWHLNLLEAALGLANKFPLSCICSCRGCEAILVDWENRMRWVPQASRQM